MPLTPEEIGAVFDSFGNRDEEALPYVDLALDPIPPRAWLVGERIPMRNVSLLGGEGAIGKSLLLMQLSGATVLAKDWIGTLPEPGPALYMSCEEEGDEVCRRMEAVAVHLGTTRQEMIDRGLRFLSFAGRDAVLAQPDRNGIMRPAPLFERVRRDALQLRPKLIVIDTVADTFGGKENDRAQTRQFITMLRGLAIDTGSAVVISAHPSLTGIATDSGLSADIDHLFIKLLRRFTEQGRNVSDKVSPSYAPSVFASEHEARAAGTTKKALAEAMARLFAAGKIRVVPFGPASKMRGKIVETEADEPSFQRPFQPPSNAFQPPSNGVCAHTPYTPQPVGTGQAGVGSPAPFQREERESRERRRTGMVDMRARSSPEGGEAMNRARRHRALEKEE